MKKKNFFDPIAWANKNKARRNENQHIGAPSPVNNPQTVTEAEVQEVARLIMNRGIDITVGYQNWLNLGFALADGLGESGRGLYHELSRMNSGYNPSECDKQYSACLNGHGKGITIRTFFQMAKEAGVDLGEVAKERLGSAYTATTATTANCQIAKNDKGIPVLPSSNSTLADGSMAVVAVASDNEHNGFTFSDKLELDHLNHILSKIYELHHDDTPKCDAMMLGALNVISGMMGAANYSGDKRSGVFGIYDSRTVYAPLYNIIYAGAGNEKGNLVFAKKLMYPIKVAMRKQYEGEKADYEAKKAAWLAQSKKDRSEAPVEPIERKPFLPGNSTSSAVYRALDANGGWGLMFETEADTVSNMLDSDFGNYSDLMRKAHHHETVSMDRVTDNVHIEIEEPRMSILLTCTPGQLPRLFPSCENGLISRFLFYNMPDENVDFHNVFARKTSLDDIYKELGDYLYPLYQGMLMRAGHPVQFCLSDSQQQLFLDTYKKVLKVETKMNDNGIRAFVLRLALENFRYAMILSVLRMLDEWHADAHHQEPVDIFKEDTITCDDRDFHTAMRIVGCLLNHTARIYTVLGNDNDNPFRQAGFNPTPGERLLYDALPEGEFHTTDVMKKAMSLNIPERSAYRYLRNLGYKYCVVIPGKTRGLYSKPPLKQE